MKTKLVILVIPFILFGFRDPSAISATDKIKNIFKSTRDIKSLTYDFHREERIKGEIIKNQSSVKMQRIPYRVYLKEITPNAGIEVLYPAEKDEDKALVNPNGFPWINLKLQATGELMRRNQHHTILDGGYDYVVSVMEYTFYKYRSNISDYVNSNGTANFDGHSCDIITLTNPNFKYINYTVKQGESIASIASKFRLNEYMIFEKNENIGFLNDVRVGDVIKLPSDYCTKMTLYIDQEREIPLKMEVFDDQGLFERYEFRNVVINPTFKSNEFSEKYSAYHFN